MLFVSIYSLIVCSAPSLCVCDEVQFCLVYVNSQQHIHATRIALLKWKCLRKFSSACKYSIRFGSRTIAHIHRYVVKCLHIPRRRIQWKRIHIANELWMTSIRHIVFAALHYSVRLVEFHSFGTFFAFSVWIYSSFLHPQTLACYSLKLSPVLAYLFVSALPSSISCSSHLDRFYSIPKSPSCKTQSSYSVLWHSHLSSAFTFDIRDAMTSFTHTEFHIAHVYLLDCDTQQFIRPQRIRPARRCGMEMHLRQAGRTLPHHCCCAVVRPFWPFSVCAARSVTQIPFPDSVLLLFVIIIAVVAVVVIAGCFIAL